jgi:hypothetical protein
MLYNTPRKGTAAYIELALSHERVTKNDPKIMRKGTANLDIARSREARKNDVWSTVRGF